MPHNGARPPTVAEPCWEQGWGAAVGAGSPGDTGDSRGGGTLAPWAVQCHVPRAGAHRRKSLPAPPSLPRKPAAGLHRDAVLSREQARRVLLGSQGCKRWDWANPTPELSRMDPGSRAVRGRRREGRGRAGRPEEGPPLSSCRHRAARWAQLGLSPPATTQPSPGSALSPQSGSCAGASLPIRASSCCADEYREGDLGAAGIRLAGTRLGESRRRTIGRTLVGDGGSPAPAGTRPRPPWWSSWAGTSPRFWLSSRKRVSEMEGGSSALSLHNPCPPGTGCSPTRSGQGGCHPRGRKGRGLSPRGEGREGHPSPSTGKLMR